MVGMSMAMILAACGQSDDPSSSSGDGGSGSNGGSTSSDGDKPWDDASKPYVTEKKMANMIASLKESTNPFRAFTKGLSAFNAQSRLAEFDTYAKKNGFESGEEYMASWMRIMGVYTYLLTDDGLQSMIKGQEEIIKNTQEALKKPDLTPDMRKMYEEQVKGAQEGLQALKQPRESPFNAQDIEVVRKNRAAFEEAVKEMQK